MAFSSQPVEDAKLAALFEAARWAPSSNNEQPWTFVIVRRGTEAHARLSATLAGANQLWAPHAPVLGVSVAKTVFERNGKTNRHAWHDTGLASMSLALEAVAQGLITHFMAGFDAAAAREALAIPEGHEPVAAFALGYHASAVPPELESRENRPRTRKALSAVVNEDAFGAPAAFVTPESSST